MSLTPGFMTTRTHTNTRFHPSLPLCATRPQIPTEFGMQYTLYTSGKKEFDGGYPKRLKVSKVPLILKPSTTPLQRGQVPHSGSHRLARCKQTCTYPPSPIFWSWPHTSLRLPSFLKDRRLSYRQARCQPNEVNSDTGKASTPQCLPIQDRNPT